MTGPVEWAVLIFIISLIATVAGTSGAVAWLVRGIKADMRDELMKTAEIITDKISASRNYIRVETQSDLKKLEDHFDVQVERMDKNISTLAAELKMHRAEDATAFREVGERIARLEAVS